MEKSKARSNRLYIIFAVLIVVIIGLFAFVIIRISTQNNNKYEVKKDSILYTSSSNYKQVKGKAKLIQKIDGYFYLHDSYGGNVEITKIAKTAISSNPNDMSVVNIYGVAYQVDEKGEVTILSKNTEIPTNLPTKFFKIDDRKYLFVDKSIKSSDNSIDTTGYIIIELDKEGNASFANNELNIKTIKPIIIKGSTFEFDIANEKLLYGKKVIDLKKVLGSTNKYKKQSKKSNNGTDNKDKDTTNGKNSSNGNSDGSSGGGGSTTSFGNGGSSSGGNYYDDYFQNVVNTVNNLTYSVSGINDNTKGTLKKDDVYFDFSKWLAIKSLSSSVNSITINYQVFDPNNEYQTIFVEVASNGEVAKRIYINKNDTSAIIRDLMFGQAYTVALGYTTVSNVEPVIQDSVTINTLSPDLDLEITKLTASTIYYKFATKNFKLDSGQLSIYGNDHYVASTPIDVIAAARESGFSGSFSRTLVNGSIEIRLENAYYNGQMLNINIHSKIVR